MTVIIPSHRRLALATIASIALASAGVLVTSSPAVAATVSVLNANDAGLGSLRAAIITANGTVGVADTIVFDPSLAGQTITIGSPLLITDTLTISGGAESPVIERSALTDVFVFRPTSPGQDFTLSGVTVQNGFSNDGRAVVADDFSEAPRNVTVFDATFDGLETFGVGGSAIFVQRITGTLRVENSVFTENVADGDGGAISAFGVGSAIVLTDNRFENNQSFGDGGAVWVDSLNANVTLTNNTFSDNASLIGNNGGALWAEYVSDLIVTGGSFTNNSAEGNGGGAGVSAGASVAVTGTAFTLNSSTEGFGGGLYLGDFESTPVTLTNTVFTSNFGDDGGGGLASVGSSPVVVQDSYFFGNEANGNGGGIYVGATDRTFSVERSTFESNVSGLNGAGLYLDGVDPDGAFSVHSSTFFDNDVDDFGSSLALASIAGEATIINSTLNEEEAGAGFALISTVFDEGELRIRYSTILGGVLIEGNDNVVDIVSSIVDGGTNPSVTVILGGNPVDVSYSLLTSALDGNVTDGGGNQFSVADTKLGSLQDNGGPTWTRMPLAGSPAIDKGYPGGTPPTFDQRYTGFPRVINGRVDVGAVETAAALAATGTTINPAIPITGGVLLLGGIAAVLVAGVRRRRSN